MKKVLFFIAIVILLGCLSVGWAQVIHYANQTTIVWDAVTKYQNGTALPTGAVVTYEIFLKDGAQTKIGQTTTTQFIVTLTDYLIRDVGVRASITSGGTTYYSELTWSSVDGKPSPFVLQVYPAPAKVQNLRVE